MRAGCKIALPYTLKACLTVASLTFVTISLVSGFDGGGGGGGDEGRTCG